jgi:ankyrin repeat protein
VIDPSDGPLDVLYSLDDQAPVLAFVAAYGYRDAVKLFLDHEGDVNATDSRGTSILMHAIAEDAHPRVRRAALVQMLLEHGAKVAVGNRDGETALSMAKYAHDRQLIELLVRAGAKR